MARGFLYAVVGFILCLVMHPGLATAMQYLWQTDSVDNDVYIYELETFLLVEHPVLGSGPNSIAAPDDAHVVYLGLENKKANQGQLLWVDPQSFNIQHRLGVGPEPYGIATTPDGRWIYVPCGDGYYWVIDAPSKTVATRIRTDGRPHETVASQDGRYMYLSPMGLSKQVAIVDIEAGHRITGYIPFGAPLQEPALTADQSLFFQHVDGLNGFQVADIAQRGVIATIAHSTQLGKLLPVKRLGWLTPQGFKRCHGLAIRPDQREIWSVCAEYVTVHALRPPDFPERHTIQLMGQGSWLTFTPDSRYAFVALTDREQVAVMDTETKAVVRHLKAGKAPMRNLVITLP